MRQDYQQAFDIQREWIVHVHLKDGYPARFALAGEPAPALQLFGTPLGEGRLDIPWIMEALGRLGYGGFVSVEYESWHPEFRLPPAEEGLARARAYLAAWLSG